MVGLFQSPPWGGQPVRQLFLQILLDLLVDWVLLPLAGSVLPLLVGSVVVGVVLLLCFLRHFLLAVVG